MKCKRDFDGRSLNHLVLQTLRQRAVEAVQAGNSATAVAAVLGLNPRTVFRWLAAYEKDGPDALLARPITGRPRKEERSPQTQPISRVP